MGGSWNHGKIYMCRNAVIRRYRRIWSISDSPKWIEKEIQRALIQKIWHSNKHRGNTEFLAACLTTVEGRWKYDPSSAQLLLTSIVSGQWRLCVSEQQLSRQSLPSDGTCRRFIVSHVNTSSSMSSGNTLLVVLRPHSEFSRPTPRRCWRSLGPPSRALDAHLNNNNTFS